MVVLELALTLVLLVGAGLMIRSFLKLYTLDLGIKTDNLLAIGMGLSNTKYPNADARRAFYDNFGPRLASIPGAQSVAFTIERAAVRHQPPRVRARRRAGAQARRTGAAGQHGDHQSRRSSRPSACSCAAGASSMTRTAIRARRTSSSTSGWRRSSSRTRTRSGAGCASSSRRRTCRPASAARPGVAHHRRHQPDDPARQPAGRGADQRRLSPAPAGSRRASRTCWYGRRPCRRAR